MEDNVPAADRAVEYFNKINETWVNRQESIKSRTSKLEKGRQMRKASNSDTTAEGQAALAICESLLIALQDLEKLSLEESRDVLLDAAAAHRGAGGTPHQIARHEAVAAIIDRIRTGGNSVP